MGGLRITGGTLRGRKVPVPPSDVRPTSERARQAYFNIVAGRIHSARFLDLFAGSGIFSLEAVSRGATAAVAIEQSFKAATALGALAKAWDVPVTPIAAEVFAGMKRLPGGVFDLIYADPPYDFPRYPELLETISGEVPLTDGALVAVEHRRHTEPFAEPPASLPFVRRAEYGEVWISFFEREAAE
jgi:16S rRNA (guanine966-N2)-methyltransferase